MDYFRLSLGVIAIIASTIFVMDDMYSVTEYYDTIWAEENSALGANLYEWAYGNGDEVTVNGGVPVFVPDGYKCELVAVGAQYNGSTSYTYSVNCRINGVIAGTAVIAGKSGEITDVTAYEITNGQRLVFQTATVTSGGTAGFIATAYLRYYKEN